jgi:hypothetical protein
MKQRSVASLHDTRHAPTVAGTLICEASLLELVEADVPNLGSCATLVVPELGEKGM